MKKNRRFHFVLTILVAAISATLTVATAEAAVNVGSSSWVWQNPLPQGDTLTAISCPSASTCFAVGDLGTILVTTNGGTGWAGQVSPINQTLRGVSCPNTTVCYTVGDAGTILKTDGAGWFQQPQPSGPVKLTGISCPSASTCYAVGYSTPVLYTDTNGASWRQLTGSGTAISCPTTTTCYMVGADPIKGRFVGGLWQVESLSVPPVEGSLTAISCISESTCVAASSGGDTIATTSYGYSWTRASLGPYVTLQSVSCVSLGETICYAVGRVGGTSANEVFVSGNGGTSWSAVSAGDSIGIDRSLNGVSCQTGLEGSRPPFSIVNLCFAVGDFGAIVTDSPSGSTWTSQQTNAIPVTLDNSTFSGVSCPAIGACFAAGNGPGIAASTNGTTWTQKYPGLGGQAISCPSITYCFAVGTNSILATTDGGASWKPQSLGGGISSALAAVSCPDTNTCFAAGTWIFATINGGATPWKPQLNFGGALGISCPSTNSCVAVGLLGTIVFTTKGGLDWKLSPSGTSQDLHAVSCPTTTSCIAVGNSNTILAGTFSGGNWSWAPQTSPLPSSTGFSSVSCMETTGSMLCYAGTYFGDILTGPGTWRVEAKIDGYLNGMSCVGSFSLFVRDYQCVGVGNSGAILSKTVSFIL
jgi:photosystem II stability/assembly factor-like uncharacterized protein